MDIHERITTVLPTYRRPALLRRAIESVLSQTYPHFELHIYDNASGDETCRIVAEFACRDRRIKYHCQPENIGPIANFAFGAARVVTPFFNILSDDDLVAPDFFQRGIETFNRHPTAGLFCGAAIKADPLGRVIDVPVDRLPEGLYPPPEGLFALLENGHTDWTGIVFRAAAVSAVGGLDVRAGTAVDIDIQWRVASQHAIVISKEPGGVFFVHPDQVSSRPIDLARMRMVWNSWRAMLANVKAIQLFNQKDSKRVEQFILRRMRRSLCLHACSAAASGHSDAARFAARVLAQELGSRYTSTAVRVLSTALAAMPIEVSEPFVSIMYRRSLARPRNRIPRPLRTRREAFVRELLDRYAHPARDLPPPSGLRKMGA